MHVIEWIEDGILVAWHTPNLSAAVKFLKELEAANIKATHIFEE